MPKNVCFISFKLKTSFFVVVGGISEGSIYLINTKKKGNCKQRKSSTEKNSKIIKSDKGRIRFIIA